MSKKQKNAKEKEGIKDTAQNLENKVNNKEEGGVEETKNSESEVKEEEKQEEKVDESAEKERQLMEKLSEIQEKYLRLSAEFDNYRKRTLKEKMDLQKYASEHVLVDTLPLMDDFERAIEAMEKTEDSESIRSGVKLIYNKFCEFLKKSGIKEIEALNCDFDVDIHDAVAKIPVQEKDKKGKIVDVVQKGYLLQDKVIRHSKVVIGE